MLKMFPIFKECQRLANKITASCTFSRGLFTCHPSSSINIQLNQKQCHQKHQTDNQQKQLLQGTSGPLLNYETVRLNKRVFYHPSAQRRIFKHGLEARLSTRGGKEILWRRILKGRHHLTAFDQFLEDPIPMTEEQKRKLGLSRFNIPKRFYKHKDFEKNKHKFN